MTSTPQSKTPLWRKPWVIPAATGIVGLLIGFAAGGGDAAEPAAAPTVTATVTTTATATATATVVATAAQDDAPASPTAAPAPGELDSTTANQACGDAAEQVLSLTYPGAKVSAHWIAGVLASEAREDGTWFVKLQASVDKADLNVECTVTGTPDDPVATVDAVY